MWARRRRPHFERNEAPRDLGGGTLCASSTKDDNIEPLLLRATGRVFHFMLRTRGWPWIMAVVSSRATRQKSE